MSIRVKVVLIISGIAMLITASSMAISIYFSRLHMVETIESDMTAVGQIASKLVSTNARLLKTDADAAAAAILSAAMNGVLSGRGEQDLPAALEEQAKLRNYASLTILNSRGAALSYGGLAPPADFFKSPYARRAFVGERVITTTEQAEGGLVVRICVPMGSRILVATLPGMIFSDILSEFTIWSSGNLMLLDGEGIIIAHTRPSLVLERRALVDTADPDPKTGGPPEYFSHMNSGTVGTGIYRYEGQSRVGAHVPVSGSDGWLLAVAAPLDESPASQTWGTLLLSAAVFMGLGVLAALIAGKVIAKPFYLIQEQNLRLEELKQTAEKASRAKSDFLSNMSHEMRTPMNAIIGMTSIAKNSSDPERKDYCLSKIEDASNHLLGVINDILDMSKIEANKFDLSLEAFNFEKMLQKVVNVINFRVDQKQLNFLVRLDKDIPSMLIGDDQRLAQVIANLLGNAVKFTPEQGSINLDAHLERLEGDRCVIRIAVTDTGIGISPEQRSRLFRSFEQAENSTARKFGGTGLGLAISKSIVEMMGGRIWVESEPGKGSTFAFVAELAKAPETEKKAVAYVRSSLSILMVDDDPEARDYFGDLSKRFGLSHDTAGSGEEALAALEKHGPYSLYFIDWKMPGMNGIELSRRIRDRDGGAGNSVIIIVSATEWSVIEGEAKRAGVDRFLAKPFFPSSFVDCVNEALGMETILKQETGPDEGIEDITGCFAGRRVLLAEDMEINQEIVLALLEPTELQIDCASNGVEALRMYGEAPGRYDMIFMDVQMPEMDGYDATRRIRSLEAGDTARPVPIIAMTANVFREDIEKCLASGMNDHVGKPIDLAEVLDKLRQYLPQQRLPATQPS
ncbi:MAG: response regulator [Treponema sp.]|jgi:signal transduction histidine kinase/DNA-binding response OmpR family regulator|nr:response regulator [Treponema sp.]